MLDHVEKHPRDIAKITAVHFGITRQAVHKHLSKLKEERCLIEAGQTKSRSYRLATFTEWTKSYTIKPGIEEDVVWTLDIQAVLGKLPENVINIWHFGFTEMFNNALDHSGGTTIEVRIRKTAVGTEMLLRDDGVGIFKKIQAALDLLDERHAILELSKGKLTTDPKNHTGEGIFFTSRLFDSFDILSGGVYFSHKFGDLEDWILERDEFSSGTAVWMKLSNHTSRTAKKIFDQYVSGDDYGFTKTVVPVKLARYGNDQLISRSQAKRLLARVQLFETVIFDFSEVDSVGQAFADEIFRVFANRYPKIKLLTVKANSVVKRMIERAKSVRLASG